MIIDKRFQIPGNTTANNEAWALVRLSRFLSAEAQLLSFAVRSAMYSGIARLDRRSGIRWRRKSTVAFAFTLLYDISTTSCANNWYLENYKGDTVPAALDLESCNLLATKEFDVLSQDERSSYNEALRSGRIVLLRNGTNIEQGQALDFTNRRLRPYLNTGPITSGEEVRRHIGTYMWVVIEEGPLKGKRVCVSTSMRRGRNPPP